MPYNPAVHGPGADRNKRRNRVIDPRSGRRHSDIISKYAPGVVHAVDVSKRVQTDSGWRVEYFKGETFEMYYELLCARNSTGCIQNPDKDRCIRILSGHLYVTIGGEVLTVLTNQVCTLQRGMEYELASSGESDAEMLVVQDAGYDEGLIHVSDPTAGSRVSMSRRLEPTVRSRGSAERAMQAAEQMKESKEARMRERTHPVPKRPALPGQTVVGMNPRPMGPGGFGSDD